MCFGQGVCFLKQGIASHISSDIFGHRGVTSGNCVAGTKDKLIQKDDLSRYMFGESGSRGPIYITHGRTLCVGAGGLQRAPFPAVLERRPCEPLNRWPQGAASALSSGLLASLAAVVGTTTGVPAFGFQTTCRHVPCDV